MRFGICRLLLTVMHYLCSCVTNLETNLIGGRGDVSTLCSQVTATVAYHPSFLLALYLSRLCLSRLRHIANITLLQRVVNTL